MTTDREIEEVAARCVSIAIFYHNCRRSRRAEEQFEDDVRSVARWVAEASLGEKEADRRLLHPLQSALIARYGVEVGTSLRADFLAAYRDASRSEKPGQAAGSRPRSLIGKQEAGRA